MSNIGSRPAQPAIPRICPSSATPPVVSVSQARDKRLLSPGYVGSHRTTSSCSLRLRNWGRAPAAVGVDLGSRKRPRTSAAAHGEDAHGGAQKRAGFPEKADAL